MKSKRSKACDMTQKVKKIASERDHKCCVLCGSNMAMPNAHYIPRSKGGLGVEENVVTLCLNCHHKLDQSSQRKEMLSLIRTYLSAYYGDKWDEDKLVYHKYENTL